MVGSALLVAGLLGVLAAALFDRLAVRTTAPGTPAHRLRRRLHLAILAASVAVVFYAIWHLQHVPQGPNV